MVDRPVYVPNGAEIGADRRLVGDQVVLRPIAERDLDELQRIRSTPEVVTWWRDSHDMAAELRADLDDNDVEQYVIVLAAQGATATPPPLSEAGDQVVGLVQWGAEDDPDYVHATIDIYIDPDVHRRGLGTDALTTLIRYLFTERGHHRVTIDPAADNRAAIATYSNVGFRPVGVMRQYERGSDGTWHDGLLMELLARDFPAG